MTVPGSLYTPLIRKIRSSGHVIEGSARTTLGDLIRTPSSASNLKTNVIEVIFKGSSIMSGGEVVLFQAYNGSSGASTAIQSNTVGQIRSDFGDGGPMLTTSVLRDPAAWYHLIVAYDTTQATDTNRGRMFLNGTQLAVTSSNWPTLNSNGQLNSQVQHAVMSIYDGRDSANFDGHMARFAIYDGLSIGQGASTDLSPFGEVTADGFWKINDVSELTFGTNGVLMEGGTNVAAGYDSSLVATADRPTTTVSASSSQYTGAIGTSTFLADDLTVATNSSVRVNDTFTGDFSISFDGYNGGSGIGRTLLYPSSEDGTYNSAKQPGANYGDFTGNQFLIDHNDGSYYSNGASLTASLGATYGVRVTVTRKGSVLSIYYDGAFKAVFANGYSGTLRLVHGGAIATATINTVNWTDWSATGLPNDYTKAGTITAITDSPTDDADNNYGNYAYLSPLASAYQGHAQGTISNNNRTFAPPNNSWGSARSTHKIPDSGKWYFEGVPQITNTGTHGIGLIDASYATNMSIWRGGVGATGGSVTGLGGVSNGSKENYTTNDVLGIAIDMDAGTQKFYKNGTIQPNASAVVTNLISARPPAGYVTYCACYGYSGGNSWTLAFLDGDFAQTPPTGYKALSTANFPEPAIPNSDDYYHNQIVTHDGTSTAATCTFNLDTYEWLAIIKNTTGASEKWYWIDSLRGVTKYMSSDATTAETTDANVMTVSGTTFTLGSTLSAKNYLVEFHKAGLASATASNEDGSINTTATSVNTTSGFSINLLTGTGSNATVGHGLSKAPEWVIHKERSPGGNNWATWHVGLPGTQFMALDTSAGPATAATKWNSTIPTSSVYSLGTDTGNNQSAATYVTYLWHSVEGYSNISTYNSNNSANGPMVNLGGMPATITMKRVGSWNWHMIHKLMDPYNQGYHYLEQNTTIAMDTSTTTNEFDLISNGLMVREGGNNAINGTAGEAHYYIAFGIQPVQGNGTDTSQGRAR